MLRLAVEDIVVVEGRLEGALEEERPCEPGGGAITVGTPARVALMLGVLTGSLVLPDEPGLDLDDPGRRGLEGMLNVAAVGVGLLSSSSTTECLLLVRGGLPSAGVLCPDWDVRRSLWARGGGGGGMTFGRRLLGPSSPVGDFRAGVEDLIEVGDVARRTLSEDPSVYARGRNILELRCGLNRIPVGRPSGLCKTTPLDGFPLVPTPTGPPTPPEPTRTGRGVEKYESDSAALIGDGCGVPPLCSEETKLAIEWPRSLGDGR